MPVEPPKPVVSPERADAYRQMEAAWGNAASTDPNKRIESWDAFYVIFEKFGEAVWNEAVQECLKNPGDEPGYHPTLVKGENPYAGIALPAPYPTPEERGVYGATMIDPELLEASEKAEKNAVTEGAPMPDPAAPVEDVSFGAPAAAPVAPVEPYFVVARMDVQFRPGLKVYCVVTPSAKPRAPGNLRPTDMVAFCITQEAATIVAKALTLLRQKALG